MLKPSQAKPSQAKPSQAKRITSIGPLPTPKILVRGFTLIELLVVVGIIALLVGLGLTLVPTLITKGKITQSIQWSRHIYDVLGAELVGDWEFDEGTGTTALDSSGLNNNGTIYGATYTDENPFKYTGIKGRYALSFDGQNDYVKLPSRFNLAEDFTISWWCFYEIGTTISNADGPLGRIGADINFYGEKVRLYVFDAAPSNRIVANTKPTRGIWQNWVFTRAGAALKIYLNAREDASNSLGAFGIFSFDWLGRTNAGYNGGLIDEVRIYNSGLTSAQVKQLYYAGLQKLLAKGEISKEEYNKK